MIAFRIRRIWLACRVALGLLVCKEQYRNVEIECRLLSQPIDRGGWPSGPLSEQQEHLRTSTLGMGSTEQADDGVIEPNG